MNSVLVFVIAAVVASLGLGAQQPVIQHGRVEMRPASSIDREIASVGVSPDPVWIGWQVPMVIGERNLCSSWSDDRTTVRGALLESRPTSSPQPEFAVPPGPVRLEAGTQLLVLARVIDGRLERVRAFSDDCPLDAGDRSVVWLRGITPAESLRFLDGLTRASALNVNETQRLAESAVSAIGWHRDPGADVMLDRLTSSDTDRGLRRQAANALGSVRGQHGYERLTALLASETNRSVRQQFVTALAQSPQPDTATVLLARARQDPDAGVRAEAAYWYVQRAGSSSITNAAAIISADVDDHVKQRVVSSIASLPEGTSVPVLIGLARTDRNLVVRKEAVSALGRSKDARARAFLDELLK